MRFGTSALGSVLFIPSGSPPIVGVKGTPEVADSTPPTCHPETTHAAPEFNVGMGISYVKFASRLWLTLKSERPRLILGLNHRGLDIEFRYSSPTRLPDEVSIAFPQV